LVVCKTFDRMAVRNAARPTEEDLGRCDSVGRSNRSRRSCSTITTWPASGRWALQKFHRLHAPAELPWHVRERKHSATSHDGAVGPTQLAQSCRVPPRDASHIDHDCPFTVLRQRPNDGVERVILGQRPKPSQRQDDHRVYLALVEILSIHTAPEGTDDHQEEILVAPFSARDSSLPLHLRSIGRAGRRTGTAKGGTGKRLRLV